MGMALPIMLMVGMMVVSVVAIYAILMNDKKKRKKVKYSGKAAKKDYYKNYKFLNENFLTRKTFRRVVEQFASLSIYNIEEVRNLAVKYYSTTLGLCLVLILVAVICFRDITAVLLVCVFAMVMFNTLIMKRVDNVHFQVLKEFSDTLSSIRETYTVVGNIPDAIGECRKGKLLPKALDKIYLILTATDAEDRLEEYYRTVPFPMLQTLAGVCYLLNDAGDEKDERGVSAFKNAISLLKNECDLEVRKLTKQKIMFSMLEYLPLFPLPFVGVLEWFFGKFMPGTVVIYNGLLGYISQTLIILSAIFAYWYITNVTSPSVIRRNDRSEFVDAFMDWYPIKKVILPNILPKKARLKRKVELLLKGAMSNKDIKYIYAAKLLVSSIACVATFVALVLFTYMAKEFTRDNIMSATFMATGNMSVDEARRWHEFDDMILERTKCPSNSDLINNGLIASYFSELSTMDIKDQADRVIKKWKDYHSLNYHWWYLLIAYGVAAFAWFTPGMMLDLRKKLVKDEEEEDVLQLQTMLAILRYTSLDAMEALYWLGRQSRIYQTAIYYAYHEYPSDPELAIERLRDKSNLPEFQQICERLLSCISQITLKEAFMDLESERDHMLRIREMVQTNYVEKKRRQCSPISRAPLMIMVFGHVLMPIGVLAFNELSSMMEQLGAL